MAALFIVSFLSNFNLSGYTYHLDEKTDLFTLQDGFLKKREIYSGKVNEENSIQIAMILLDISHAEELWYGSIIVFWLFVVALFGIVVSRWKSKKHAKWLIFLCFIGLATFIIWDFNAHKEVLQEIEQTITYLLS